MNIKVSVIIPVYNGRETIARCLESVMGQTLSDIEIIVVNDGSSDDTLSVLSTFNDERITVISQENAGQGFARNTGMRAARGEYISFVDADDTVEADMLEKMYGGALSSAADVVQCNITDIYSDGRRVTQLKSVDETVTVTDCGDYTDKYFTTCRHSYEVCNKLFKRVFLEQTGVKFRDTKKYFSEDLMFNLELIPHIKTISFISAAYYNYYQHENSHFHARPKERLEAVSSLFFEYIKNADGAMRDAASYTAAMITAYNAGQCAYIDQDAAAKALSSEQMKGYINAALKRNCKPKHRIFLCALKFLPVSLKLAAAKKYVGRWE